MSKESSAFTSESLAAGAGQTLRGSNPLVWPLILCVLVLLLYAAIIKSLVLQWWSDPDYGHGFFVPLFAAYVCWHQRKRWEEAAVKPSDFGLLVMLGSVALLLLGSLGAESFISRFSLLILLMGIILFLAGWGALRVVLFPLAYLAFMIPIPVILYNQLTFPLQLLASRLATFGLEAVRVPVLREGNVLILSNYSLEVVEACSGIRSLMTLISLAVAYGYLVEPRRWIRFSLAALMVPVAIVSNAIRVMGAGVMAHRFGSLAAEGFLHGFSGWVLFDSALILMLVCHWLLRQVGKGRITLADV